MSVSGERDFIRLVMAKSLAGFMSEDDIEDVAFSVKTIERVTGKPPSALEALEMTGYA